MATAYFIRFLGIGLILAVPAMPAQAGDLAAARNYAGQTCSAARANRDTYRLAGGGVVVDHSYMLKNGSWQNGGDGLALAASDRADFDWKFVSKTGAVEYFKAAGGGLKAFIQAQGQGFSLSYTCAAK